MSWKPEIQTVGDPEFYQNAQAFATKEEAEFMAKDIFQRWMLATDYRAVESDQEVSHCVVEGVVKPVPANFGQEKVA